MKDKMKDYSNKKEKKTDLFDYDSYFKQEVQQGKPIYDPKGKCNDLLLPKAHLSDYRKSQTRGFR